MGEQLRAYRYALDLTDAQASAVAQHAGAARWAYNHAIATKFKALDERQAVIRGAVDAGADPAVAAKQAPKIPTRFDIQKALNQVKGDDRTDQEGVCPWWHSVSTLIRPGVSGEFFCWEGWARGNEVIEAVSRRAEGASGADGGRSAQRHGLGVGGDGPGC